MAGDHAIGILRAAAHIVAVNSPRMTCTIFLTLR
jgi:hypothetical protein